MSAAETDRELLELAAKAYGGLEYEPYDGWVHTGAHGKRGDRWNPRDDDGDALRLAVKLGLRVETDSHPIYVEDLPASVVSRTAFAADGTLQKVNVSICHYGDPCAATRRAIVRAAANIGKTMP